MSSAAGGAASSAAGGAHGAGRERTGLELAPFRKAPATETRTTFLSCTSGAMRMSWSLSSTSMPLLSMTCTGAPRGTSTMLESLSSDAEAPLLSSALCSSVGEDMIRPAQWPLLCVCNDCAQCAELRVLPVGRAEAVCVQARLSSVRPLALRPFRRRSTGSLHAGPAEDTGQDSKEPSYMRCSARGSAGYAAKITHESASLFNLMMMTHAVSCVVESLH